jgi:tetratricopeptide (TPR) repeat protein
MITFVLFFRLKQRHLKNLFMKKTIPLLLIFLLPVIANGQFNVKRDSLHYYKFLAQAEFDMIGDYASSSYYLTKAIRLDPGDYELYEQRAIAKSFLEDNKGAENDLSIVLQLDPGNFAAYAGRAYARVKLKKYQEAIQDFNFLIQSEPAFQGYYLDRGLLKLELKDLDGACSDFRQATTLGSATGYRNLMDYCYR